MLWKYLWIVVIASLLTNGVLQAAPNVEEGKSLFMANCASCHSRDMKTNLTGPALAGVEERWAAYPRQDLYKWIRASQALIQEGHPRAVELWNQWKPTLMNNFPGLTDEQIESILLYINDVANKASTSTQAGQTAQPVSTAKDDSTLWILIAVGVILALLALALMRVVDNLQNLARVQAGQPPVRRTLAQILTTKGAIAFMVFAATLILGYKTVDNATRMGRQQGYQPEQPIAFSHALHAGANKIDCQYCHDSARKSKHASIPGANTCMNCHTVVKKGSKTGTAEITKIFASIGYDPITNKYIPDYDKWTEKQIAELYKKWIAQEYMADHNLKALDETGRETVETQWEGIVKALKDDSNGKIQGPIEWVRVHNLPDHAYFSHAQHVAVGQVACQQCHGPIEQMEEVYQYSTLGMGWCINCHRQTEVKFADNDYYQQYARYHEELKSGKRQKVTVEDIGGLECQKCHY
ncbi:MAG: c-type cytochrome [Saprospiraceae bacterium]|nr:c-type cytochrome [Saprospiraceae bacterium]MDW8482760.1 c-type cytochrome [Saprospiraceae bacterium]